MEGLDVGLTYPLRKTRIFRKIEEKPWKSPKNDERIRHVGGRGLAEERNSLR